MSARPRVAVLIPCYNEALAIAKVVADFRSALPEAEIYVYDNNSNDSTVQSAKSAGAIVRHEGMQGKGHVVCRMFADVDADVYLLVDGDGTYDASSAPALVDDLLSGPCDMINGRRVETGGANYRPGHRIGNRVLTGLVKRLFRQGFNDMLSGYKAFSRRYVKSFPALSQGFEIETELIVHALNMKMAVKEIDTPYFSRMEGSASKLNTWRDGWRILRTIVRLVKNERPMPFFGGIAAALLAVALVLFVPVAIDYLETGLVLRFPTLIVLTGLAVAAVVSFVTGVILDSVTLLKNETRRLIYLSIPALSARRE